MFIQLFSNYLLEKNIISTKQFNEILEAKKSAKKPLGTIAAELGFMTQEQVDITVHIQSLSDMRFGEIALSKNFITAEQFKAILKEQSNDYVLMKKILADAKLMTEAEFESQLEAFKSTYNLNNEEFAQIVDNGTRVAVQKMGFLQPEAKIFMEFAINMVNLIIRFVDRDAVIKKHYKLYQKEFSNFIFQGCIGKSALELGYSGDANTMLYIASKYAGKTYSSFDAESIDSLKEFLNCASGLFVGFLEKNHNLDYDLEVPRYYPQISAKQVWVLTVSTQAGDISIVYKE